MLPEKDKIKNVFSSKLSGYNPKVPDDIWDKIDRTLSDGQLSEKPKKVPFIRRAGVAAAVAASVLVCLMYFYSSDDKIATQISNNTPPDFKIQDKPFQGKEFFSENPEEENQPAHYAVVSPGPADKIPDDNISREYTEEKVYDVAKEKEGKEIPQSREPEERKTDKTVPDKEQLRKGIEEFEKLGQQDRDAGKNLFPAKNTTKNKGFALSAGGRSGLAATGKNPAQYDKLFSLKSSSYLPKDALDEYMQSAISQENSKETSYSKADVDVDHRQPISFGLTVSKNLSDRVSIETGIVYTYLSSKIKPKDGVSSKSRGSQYFHYLGVPLSVNYTFAKWEKADFYVSLGGMIQKDIYGRFKGTQESVGVDADAGSNNESSDVKIKQPNPQLSMMSTVGASYPIYDKLHVYATVGGVYYFDSKHDYKTAYTDKKVQFDLNVGLKYEF